MIDNCMKILNEFRINSTNAKKLALMAREMKKLFRGDGLHQFAIRVITDNSLAQGRLVTAAKLDYCLISPFIIIENVFAPNRDGNALKTMVRVFRGSPAMGVISFIVENFYNKEAILGKLRQQECFANYDFGDYDAKWTPKRVKDFIRHTCSILEKPIPDVARPLFVEVDIEPVITAYLRGEVEEYDFSHICLALAEDDAILSAIIV